MRRVGSPQKGLTRLEAFADLDRRLREKETQGVAEEMSVSVGDFYSEGEETPITKPILPTPAVPAPTLGGSLRNNLTRGGKVSSTTLLAFRGGDSQRELEKPGWKGRLGFAATSEARLSLSRTLLERPRFRPARTMVASFVPRPTKPRGPPVLARALTTLGSLAAFAERALLADEESPARAMRAEALRAELEATVAAAEELKRHSDAAAAVAALNARKRAADEAAEATAEVAAVKALVAAEAGEAAGAAERAAEVAEARARQAAEDLEQFAGYVVELQKAQAKYFFSELGGFPEAADALRAVRTVGKLAQSFGQRESSEVEGDLASLGEFLRAHPALPAELRDDLQRLVDGVCDDLREFDRKKSAFQVLEAAASAAAAKAAESRRAESIAAEAAKIAATEAVTRRAEAATADAARGALRAELRRGEESAGELFPDFLFRTAQVEKDPGFLMGLEALEAHAEHLRGLARSPIESPRVLPDSEAVVRALNELAGLAAQAQADARVAPPDPPGLFDAVQRLAAKLGDFLESAAEHIKMQRRVALVGLVYETITEVQSIRGLLELNRSSHKEPEAPPRSKINRLLQSFKRVGPVTPAPQPLTPPTPPTPLTPHPLNTSTPQPLIPSTPQPLLTNPANESVSAGEVVEGESDSDDDVELTHRLFIRFAKSLDLLTNKRCLEILREGFPIYRLVSHSPGRPFSMMELLEQNDSIHSRTTYLSRWFSRETLTLVDKSSLTFSNPQTNETVDLDFKTLESIKFDRITQEILETQTLPPSEPPGIYNQRTTALYKRCSVYLCSLGGFTLLVEGLTQFLALAFAVNADYLRNFDKKF